MAILPQRNAGHVPDELVFVLDLPRPTMAKTLMIYRSK
jgi:hypothetical protein